MERRSASADKCRNAGIVCRNDLDVLLEYNTEVLCHDTYIHHTYIKRRLVGGDFGDVPALGRA